MHTIWNDTVTEYGVSPTVGGAHLFDRLIRRNDRIETPAHYVGACRRLARCHGLEIARDGRLVAVGHNEFSPSRWILGGKLDEFLAYWSAAVDRPDVVGSPYNPEPEDVYRAWRSGVPARTHCTLNRRDWRIGFPVCVKWSDMPRQQISWRRLRTLRRAARAAGRTSLRRWAALFSCKALAALGRVTPETQRAIVEAMRLELEKRRIEVYDTCVVRPIRVRDIPWHVGAAAAAQMAGERGARVRYARARGLRREQVAIEHCPGFASADATRPVFYRDRPASEIIARWLTPQFPRVSAETACEIVLGRTPVEVSDGLLSRREAHDWLRHHPDLDVVEYLCTLLPEPVRVRSPLVARWLLRIAERGQWEQLTRLREIRGPGGQHIRARFLDVVDEIQDADLARGEHTPIRAAFEAAAERIGAARAGQGASDHRVLQALPRGWKLLSSVTHLNTRAMLTAEGREMQHCVGSYGDAVSRGQSVILSIRALGHKSTVEITPRGRVLQHRGPRNKEPHALCQRVLDRQLRRLGFEPKRKW